MPDWDNSPHFAKQEFKHPDKISQDLLTKLNYARQQAGVPFYITSDYREGDQGAHGEGLAVDISDNLQGYNVSSRWRYHVVRGLLGAGFSRIGIYDRHVHADVSASRDQDVIWWAQSK
jgi:hypothetical protein